MARAVADSLLGRRGTDGLLQLDEMRLSDQDLRDELREGIEEPAPQELEAWAELPPGLDVIQEVGGRPIWEGSGDAYYRQNWADASIDVNGITGGDAYQIRTIIPAEAKAKFSVRLAPGQSCTKISENIRSILTEGLPEEADVSINFQSMSDPALFDPDSDAVRLAREACDDAARRRRILDQWARTLDSQISRPETAEETP